MIISYTVESNAAISKTISAGKAVLVHCYGSISRSAVLIIAYIMESQRVSAETAAAILKEKWDAVRASKPKPSVFLITIAAL